MTDPRERAPSPLTADITLPLCVDLDGSLIRSDTLWEGLWLALRHHPWACLGACLAAPAGRAAFKRRVAAVAMADPARLPYRQDVLDLLTAEARAGRPLMLATAADELVAQGVAQHLGLFQQVIAADGLVNRKGAAKLEAIRRVAPRFLYLGDSRVDLPIWKQAEGGLVAGGGRGLQRALGRQGTPILRHFPAPVATPRALGTARRPHPGAKNLLVLLPIFLGRRTTDPAMWRAGLVAAMVFCLAASATYVLNDLLDLDADRQHAGKRSRPFAAGDLSIPAGLLLAPGLLIAALALSYLLPPEARLWAAVYFGGALLYSLYLKTRLLADVTALAMLYVLRVMAGGAATGIVISPWTLAFCLFFFYSLALVKRFSELRALPEGADGPARRAYQKSDSPILAALGAASGVLSVVIFALYVSSPEVRINYQSPDWLWLTCPVLLYWFGRLWILAHRGVLDEDPVLFSLKDKITYVAAACVAAIWLLAAVYL